MPVIIDPTDEQRDILAAGKAGKSNLLIRALAGTGKTTALLGLLEVVPFRSILLCAFNKKIATELEERIGLPSYDEPNRQLKLAIPRTTAVMVKTFHAQGLAMLKEYHRNIVIHESATEDLLNQVAGDGLGFKMRRSAVWLLRLLKETTIDENPSANKVTQLGLDYNYFEGFADQAIDLTVEAVRDAYIVSKDMLSRDKIDFCDMVWLPLVLGLRPRTRFQAIFVDELQDISDPQLAMLQTLMVPNTGKMIAVGDISQQIYQFRGSMGSRAWDVLKVDLKAKELPLTITWRCSAAVVGAAQEIVPEIRARPAAPRGHVQDCSWIELPGAIQGTIGTHASGPLKYGANAGLGNHTFVLSRGNAKLLDCALYLWSKGVAFQLNAASELLEPLMKILGNLDKSSPSKFGASLDAWLTTELAKAERANATAYADRVEEQHSMLAAAVAYAKPSEMESLLRKLLVPNRSGVLLSSVHKVKGLEAERVFLLKQTFARHKEPKPCFACQGSGEGFPLKGHACVDCRGTGRFKTEPDPAELNIEYVAVTRAKNRLVWVDIKSRVSMHDDDRPDLTVRGIIAEDQIDAVEHAMNGEPNVTPKSIRKLVGTKTQSEQLADRSRQFLLSGESDE